MRTSRIELFKEAQKFSAGHFTIFSATHRERLHGHNFQVYCAIEGLVGNNGMIRDYRALKRLLERTCDQWNEVFLLPGASPHLDVRTEGAHIYAHFDGQDIPFLADDVLVLPIRNITLEELSALLLEYILESLSQKGDAGLVAIEVRVSSGPGQWASTMWRAANCEDRAHG